MKWLILLLIPITGCTTLSVQDRHMLEQDRQNKLLEIDYLEEIRNAQKNDDRPAFEFYFREYLDVERLDMPTHLKDHPDYFIGGIKYKY